MEDQELISVGIDIGTSTTQCVFSAMRLRNTAPAFAIPRVALTDKRVLYRAPLRLTPLLSPDTIDAQAVRALVERDYRAAGIEPGQIACGAVIITGLAARKQNARAVTEALAAFAGAFVVATAGPDLEAILAGYGAGAAALSRTRKKRVLNLDIGGGTTNFCLFDAGEAVSAGCMDVGGRMLRRDPGTGAVLAMSPKLEWVAQDAGVPVSVGMVLSDAQAAHIAARMAELLEEACGLRPGSELMDRMMTEHALALDAPPDIYTFSGGVADCVYGTAVHSDMFDDIGALLGAAVARSRFFFDGRVIRPPETLHATVIGAGAYSMNVTGSTIACEHVQFPILGLPVARVRLHDAAQIDDLAGAVVAQRRVVGDPCAIGFEGLINPSFDEVERMAQALSEALSDVPCPVIVMARDMAKVLGQAILRRLGQGRPLLCIDGIALTHGDTIDIGAPLLSGRVLPVVVRTLAF